MQSVSSRVWTRVAMSISYKMTKWGLFFNITPLQSTDIFNQFCILCAMDLAALSTGTVEYANNTSAER